MAERKRTRSSIEKEREGFLYLSKEPIQIKQLIVFLLSTKKNLDRRYFKNLEEYDQYISELGINHDYDEIIKFYQSLYWIWTSVKRLGLKFPKSFDQKEQKEDLLSMNFMKPDQKTEVIFRLWLRKSHAFLFLSENDYDQYIKCDPDDRNKLQYYLAENFIKCFIKIR